jgi:hypothetical protein
MRSIGGLEEEDGVRRGRRQDAQPEDEPPPPRSPAGEGEDTEDGRQEQHVAERIGEIRDDCRERSFRAPEYELHEDRGAECGCCEGRRRTVEPEHSADRPGP